MSPLDADGELCRKAAGGDRQAMSALASAYRGPLYRFARRLVQDDALAEDVLQETFLTALRKVGGWRGEGTCRGWLFSIARTEALMAKRRRAGEPDVSAEEQEEELPALGLAAGWGAAMDPEALAAKVEEQALLERALAALGPTEREIIALRDLEGLSGEDTAQALGLSVAAMKSRLHRARLALVAAVKRGGHDGR
ncbi:MAG: sigma-70 family RNA polymerase sigma factor [Myxococcota bacterium]